MKKTLSILFIIVISIFVCYCQEDASRIMSDFLKATCLENHRNQSLRIQMEMDVQGNAVPLIISYDSARKNMRIEMSVQDNEVAMVIADNHGWVESGGQKQDLPQDFIAKTKGLTFFASVSELLSTCTFSYIAGDDNFHKIGVKTNGGVGDCIVYVDKASGLVRKVEMSGASPAVLIFSDYTLFSDVKMPSKIRAEVSSQQPTDFTLSAMSFGLKFPEWYFQK